MASPPTRRSLAAAPTDDAPTLVRRAQAGDADALTELMRAYRPLVAGTARRLLGNSADVEDAVQEVWIALLHDIDRIETPECIIAWLRRVTVRTAIRTRKRSDRASYQRDPQPLMAGESTEDAGITNVMREQKRVSVHAALGRLRPAERDVLELLMATDEPDYRSISIAASRPVGSIGPTRQRALARLRRDPALAAF
jgi:RNA polymerase sigma factor (sigma-70 family)